MTDESPTPEIGDLADKTLGEFKLLRRLGRGGMAEVYLAEQTSLSRFVAVKVLLREMVDEADGVPLKRFEQEARTAGSINHPNIVQVYTIGEENGLHYIVQEFVEGLNLSEYVKRNGPPDVLRGMDLMEQIAKAMKVASDAGIVHRDIKPENIMVTQGGVAKVADFGLAQLSQKPEALNLTQQGTTMGTPLYMSPEQINGEKLDHRSDLYSFGVLCYHMFAGRAPFRGETAMAVAVQHLKEEAEPLSDRRPDLPRAVCDIVKRMMQKEPAERFQSASELLVAITKARGAVSDGHDLSLSAMGMPAFKPAPPAKPRPIPALLAFIATCLIVGLSSAGIGYYLRPVDPLSVETEERLPKEPTVNEQFAAALANFDQASGWLAVIYYYGKRSGQEPLEVGWARVHLARLRLSDTRLDEAEEQFARVSQSTTDPSIQVQGQIGLAAIAFEKGQQDRAVEIIETARIDAREIRGTAMAGWYDRIVNRRQG